jgi:hypothetical protein
MNAELTWLWRDVILPSRWSLALAACALVGYWLVGQKRPVGWLVNIGTQVIWVGYALATHQYGFLLTAACFTVLFSRNWWTWRRPTAPVALVSGIAKAEA